MSLLGAAVLAQRADHFVDDRPHWIGIVFMVLLVALVVAGLVALIVWISRNGQAPTPGAAAGPTPSAAGPPIDARRILDERLARGDIDPEEYRSRRDALEG